jgi:hypothetical protein
MQVRMRASLAALVTAAAPAAWVALTSLGLGCEGAQADPNSLKSGMISTAGGGAGSPGASSSTGDDATSAAGDDAGAEMDGSAPSGDAAPDAGVTVGDGGSESASDGASPGAGEGATTPTDDTGVAADAASDGLVCTNLSCTTFLDCLLGHAAEVGPCGFTVCTNFVCE